MLSGCWLFQPEPQERKEANAINLATGATHQPVLQWEAKLAATVRVPEKKITSRRDVCEKPRPSGKEGLSRLHSLQTNFTGS